MRDNTSREKSREKTDCGKLVALKKKSTTTTTTDTTQRLVPEVPETKKKQHPLSLKSKRRAQSGGRQFSYKRQIRKVVQAGKSSSSSKRLARKARKAKLVVKQEKLDVGYDQALLATKYQVDQITIRLQPAGLGSDTP